MKLSFSKILLGTALLSGANAALAKPKSWVALSVQTDATQYVTGAPIDVMLNAKNTHSRAAFLHFTSGQRFDLQLFRAGNPNPLYTWSAEKLFMQSVDQLRLYPNQNQSFSARIGDEQGALVPGKYQLRAHLTNSSQIEAAPVELEIVASPVQLKATLDKTQLQIGEPLAVSISATNNSAQTQQLRFGSGQSFDVIVSDEDGQPIWNWGANKRFTMALRTVTLAPNETKTFDATWDGQALPDSKIVAGKYSVQAVLTTNPRVYAPPVRVEVK